jgi:thiamine biosynthesis lipoprotein
MLVWSPAPEGLPQSRRRFLMSLGLLAGAGAAGPLLRWTESRRVRRLESSRQGLGTWIRIVARHPDPDLAGRAIDRAHAAIALVDRQMSIHRGDSDLSRVNRGAGGSAVRVDRAVGAVVAMACEGARRTGGVYDPTVLPLMRLFGFYGPASDRVPSDRAIARVLESVGAQRVRWDPVAGTLALERGAGLDLGSIGKGWAVDRAVNALRAAGVRDGLVDAGGNIFAFGAPEDGADGWSVGVLDPSSRGIARTFVLRDTAIATSGNYEQFRVLSGVRVGHLLDARRGLPADGHLSATVLARTAVEADRMSTAAFLLGPDRFAWPEALDVHFIG